MRAGGPRLMLKHSTVLLLSILCLAVCLWPTRGAAQEVTATINGTVTDPAGNVVANADVTATDLDRGTVWPAKTNHEGYFNLTRLPVGRYEVRVTAPGFRVAVETTPDLQLNQTAVVNMQLVVGSNNETVQVTSEAPLLQTESTAVGTVIDEKANVDLPLASRNYLQLTLLTPGWCRRTRSGQTAVSIAARPPANLRGPKSTATVLLLWTTLSMAWTTMKWPAISLPTRRNRMPFRNST